MGAGQIFGLPRTDDFSRRRTTKLLTAKVVSTMAFQNKIKICPAPLSIYTNSFAQTENCCNFGAIISVVDKVKCKSLTLSERK